MPSTSKGAGGDQRIRALKTLRTPCPCESLSVMSEFRSTGELSEEPQKAAHLRFGRQGSELYAFNIATQIRYFRSFTHKVSSTTPETCVLTTNGAGLQLCCRCLPLANGLFGQACVKPFVSFIVEGRRCADVAMCARPLARTVCAMWHTGITGTPHELFYALARRYVCKRNLRASHGADQSGAVAPDNPCDWRTGGRASG